MLMEGESAWGAIHVIIYNLDNCEGHLCIGSTYVLGFFFRLLSSQNFHLMSIMWRTFQVVKDFDMGSHITMAVPC